MFKFVHRSRSTKGRATYGQGSLVLHDESLMPSCPTAERRAGVFSQNEGVASHSASVAHDHAGFSFDIHLQHPSPVTSHPWAPEMPERPVTSSGPGLNESSLTVGTENGEKRQSKDDLYILNRPATRGFKPYHIPIRGRPPSPRDDAWEGSPTRQTTSLGSRTTESRDTQNDIITIGMALGSPAHPPPGVYDNWQLPAIGMAVTSAPMEPSPGPAAPTSQRQKSVRWKLFGRSKSRNQKPDPRVAPMPAPGPTTPIPVPTHNHASVLDRSGTGRGQPKHKPLIIRSQTEPLPYTLEDPDQGFERVNRRPLDQTLRVEDRNGQPDLPGIYSDPTRSPLLNVEIPSITMERYSVMFGNVLQNQSSSSTLLARRQATVEKLKSTTSNRVPLQEQDVEDHDGRLRPTAPPSHESPSLTLFPPSPLSSASASPRSPRYRASTLPAGLPAHPRQTAYSTQPTATAVAVTKARPEPGSSPVPLPRERLESATGDDDHPDLHRKVPRASPPNQRIEQPDTAVHSATGEASPASRNEERVRPVVRKPTRKILTTLRDATKSPSIAGHHTVPGTRASPRGRAVSSPTPAVLEHAKKSSQERFDDEMTLNTAVEISIARQISISQQQRHMLRTGIAGRPRKLTKEHSGLNSLPEGFRDRVGPGTPTVKQAPAVTNVADNGRLATTKTAMPTVVTPPEPQDDSPLAEHRKSEWVVVEGSLP
ncbi:hypothetical protein ACRALDRAFT_1071722 [Sodiomyces alcalophilus JCM 7366]|uniref:uncharacterized protein n=1 Tax=Sodiomyces alcalophilus JCM 7366 TaxID=591952 RepID=UPI0039B4F6AF